MTTKMKLKIVINKFYINILFNLQVIRFTGIALITMHYK